MFLTISRVLAGAMVFMVAAASAAFAASPVTTLPAVADALAHGRPVLIAAFGSSSTEGVGASGPDKTYPARLQVDLDAKLPTAAITVVNRGRGGEDSVEMIGRLPAMLASHPTLVIWQTGTNDPLRDLPLDRFIALTREGIAAMRAAGADVMLMEPQYCPVFEAKAGALAYRDALRAIADDMGVPMIRRYDLMKSWLDQKLVAPRDLQSADGLHMADAGYALLAHAVADEIVADAGRAPARHVVADK
jgi:lysophospholipase L1-like esterase